MTYCFVIIGLAVIVFIIPYSLYDYSYLANWNDTVNCNFEALLRCLFVVAHITVYILINLLLSYCLLKIFMMPKNERTNQNDEIRDHDDEQQLMDSVNNSDHVV